MVNKKFHGDKAMIRSIARTGASLLLIAVLYGCGASQRGAQIGAMSGAAVGAVAATYGDWGPAVDVQESEYGFSPGLAPEGPIRKVLQEAAAAQSAR